MGADLYQDGRLVLPISTSLYANNFYSGHLAICVGFSKNFLMKKSKPNSFDWTLMEELMKITKKSDQVGSVFMQVEPMTEFEKIYNG